ncbi:MAG: DUF3560 domain-containing protein [Pseudoruegeria sp.]|uniref:DUF3560 domain-containing protein n=1 Tax=Roseobacteraceae TaxID=2854170 RepID=UPI003296C3B4
MQATYSPEDNKIRLYPESRLDAETFARVKNAGFKWAPRQELFVAPKWTTSREDLAVELAGEIEPEEMTIAERAQAKADRLEGLADKRSEQASAYRNAAQALSARFEFGQPILVGHHSERKARKDKERMSTADSNAVKASQAVGYWLYRAESVERHANYKNDPRTRARRIKTLLAELRDLQRRINKAYKALDIWNKLTTPDEIKKASGSYELCNTSLYYELDKGEATAEDVKSRMIAAFERITTSASLQRTITHTLHRLSYEQELLGSVERFENEITPTLLQMFVREHGADKPKGKKLDDGLFSVQCGAPLPVHIASSDYVELSADEWRDLMQRCGYVPPAKKDAKPPLLNFKAPSGQLGYVCPYRHEVVFVPQIKMTKAEYAKINSDQRGTRLSTCGKFRFRIAPNSNGTGQRHAWGRAAILITDQKAHATPDNLLTVEEATKRMTKANA